jgi:hypothetical protein
VLVRASEGGGGASAADRTALRTCDKTHTRDNTRMISLRNTLEPPWNQQLNLPGNLPLDMFPGASLIN